MIIRPLAALAAPVLLGALPLAAAEAPWSEDFAAAKTRAAEQEKALLIDFTGSDWCGWCIKLKEEVFDHDAFRDGVADDFVLVELDYPQDSSKLSEETQQQNAELQQKYGIQGFPTILLTDAAGQPFARTGYQAGGPEAYVEHLDGLLAQREQRDQALAAAREKDGVDKAQGLIDALATMGLEDAMVTNFYGDVIEEIKAADPDDETGFVQQIEMKEKFDSFQRELGALAQTQDHDAALALVDQTLASGDFEGLIQQQIAMIKGFVLAEMKEFDRAEAALDAAKELAPESEIGQQVDAIKGQLAQFRAQSEAEASDSDGEEP